jgi:uncharacterized protein DUF3632
LNFHSFLARLANEGLITGSHIAIYQLRRALEEAHTVREIANCEISVACEWIIRSGMMLYCKARNAEPLNKDEARMMKAGSLYDGKIGHCLERWQFWKSRFSVVKDEVDEEVAEMAQRAVDAMETLERDMGTRKFQAGTEQ